MTRQAGSYQTPDQLAQELAHQQAASMQGDAEGATPPAEGAEAPTPKDETPSWEGSIKKVGLNAEQGFAIIDAMIEKGYYEKTISLYGGRIAVTLRTRDAYCRQRVSSELDTLRTNDPRVHSQASLRICLAGSLVKFHKTALKFAQPNASPDAQEEAFNERLRFIDGLGDPFLDTLYPLLQQFDAWTYAALSNGAPTGF